MQSFMNDFSYFTTAFFSSIRTFLTNFISGSVLGEIFLFVVVISVFLFLIEEIISLGGDK